VRPRAGGARGFALAVVLAALVLAGALAAGALWAARLGMRDAAGAVRRVAARTAAERALTVALLPPEWDSSWAAPGAPGLVGLRVHTDGDVVDTVRVVRLGTGSYLVIADARAGAPPLPAARARLSLVVMLDARSRPRRIAAHAWSIMP
jgi:hypothetical protein